MAKAKRLSADALLDAVTARSRMGPRNWVEQLPESDRQYLDSVIENYSSRIKRPSLRMLHAALVEQMDLPVKRNAFADYVARWMKEHGKTNAG